MFDYWEGEERSLPAGARLTAATLAAFEKAYVFVSHSHPDHFDPVIYEWREDAPVTYVVSSDLPIGKRGRRIAPGEALELDENVRVRAFKSTDLGVSYLVDIYGLSVFHAGDLNLWHWRQESSLKEIEAAETAYYDACAEIPSGEIDLAMFPVDPRQGYMYDAGANYFILNKKPRVFIPMHWQERPEVAVEFCRRARTPQPETLALTSAGESATLSYEEGVLDIHIVEPPKEPGARAEKRPAGPDDPFADTDLPVDIE